MMDDTMAEMSISPMIFHQFICFYINGKALLPYVHFTLLF